MEGNFWPPNGNFFYYYSLPNIYFRRSDSTPLQYSCLENPMDGGAWWAAVHGVTNSRSRLSDFPFTFHFHALEKEMATHSSVPAWRIPGTGEPGGLLSMGSHRVGHDWSDLAAADLAIFTSPVQRITSGAILLKKKSHILPLKKKKLICVYKLKGRKKLISYKSLSINCTAGNCAKQFTWIISNYLCNNSVG